MKGKNPSQFLFLPPFGVLSCVMVLEGFTLRQAGERSKGMKKQGERRLIQELLCRETRIQGCSNTHIRTSSLSHVTKHFRLYYCHFDHFFFSMFESAFTPTQRTI